MFLDVENLLFVDRQVGDLGPGLTVIERMFGELEQRATVVARVAVCDPSLAAGVAVPLSRLGVRTFTHSGGEDGADADLLRLMEFDLPRSCNLVVIGSGDHIFAPLAERLRAAVKRVEVYAHSRAVSASLYLAADEYADLGRFMSLKAA